MLGGSSPETGFPREGDRLGDREDGWSPEHGDEALTWRKPPMPPAMAVGPSAGDPRAHAPRGVLP